MSISTKEPLQDQLDRITQNTRALVQPERLAVSEKATADLFNTGIEDRILKVGAQAPAFTLEDALTHKPVSSSDLLALGPLVIKFFRGRWDPYCVTELEAWHSLPYPLLSDPGTTLAEQFGIAHTIPQDLRRYYQSILINIPFNNSGLSYHNATEASWRLPLPAVFVMDSNNTILFSEAHADFRVRPEPADILAALER